MLYIVLFIAAVLGAMFLMSVNESMKQYAYAKRMAAVYGVSNEYAQDVMDCALNYYVQKKKGRLTTAYITLEKGVSFYPGSGALVNDNGYYEHYDLFSDFIEYIRYQYGYGA